MNLEVLKSRVTELENEISRHQANVNQQVANINMIMGAKEEALFWIKKLENAQPQADSDQVEVSN